MEDDDLECGTINVECTSEVKLGEFMPKGDKTPKEPTNEVYKERLAQYKKNLAKDLGFFDSLEMRNPQMVAEQAQEIYTTMREQEMLLKIDPDYLTKMQVPTEVKDTSRAFLVEWIIDVHRKFRLMPETLYVTVFLIDRFLSLKQIKKN